MNPALGSVAVSSFVDGFAKKNNSETPLFLCFFVIPMIFQKDIRNTLMHSQSFESFVKNLNKDYKDRLYGINHCIKQMRSLSFKSLMVSVSSGLISLDSEKALLRTKGFSGIPEAYMKGTIIKEIFDASYKLGTVISDKSPSDVMRYLNVGV